MVIRRLLFVGVCLVPIMGVCLQGEAKAMQGDASSLASEQNEPRTVPRLVKFSGTLAVSPNEPPSVRSISFTLYAEQEGGAPLWTETQNVTPDITGHYSVLLGAESTGGIPADLFASGEPRWLGVRVNEDGREQPRAQLVSVPYALRAGDAATLAGHPATDYLLASAVNPGTQPATVNPTKDPALSDDGTGSANFLSKFVNGTTVGKSAVFESGGKVGIGTTSPAYSLHINNASGIAMAVVQNDPNSAGMFFKPGSDTVPAFLMNNAANTANRHFFYGNGDAVLGYGAGHIGVGTSNPIYPLHVEGNNTSAAMAVIQNNPNGYAMLMRSANDDTPAFLVNNAANSANRHVLYGSGDAYFAVGGGLVGIGTSGPSQKLDVNGNIHVGGNVVFSDNTVQSTAAVTSISAGSGITGSGSGSLTVSLLSSCSTNQILKWSGTAWACAADATGAGGGGTVTSITAGAGIVSTPNPITTSGSIAVNLATSGGDNGSGTTVARGDHLHDGRYVQISPQSVSYSAASVSGKYAFSYSGGIPSGQLVYLVSATGTFQANGTGTITGGSVVEAISSGLVCQGTISGTYSVASSGQGSASVSTASNSPGCGGLGTSSFTLQVTQQGSSLVFAEADNSGWISGTAIRE